MLGVLVVTTNLAIRTLCATGMLDSAFLHRLNTNEDRLPECLARFSNYDNLSAKGKFERNETFYLKDLDFTCVSPWNDRTGRFRAGTAISRRHIIFAKHHPLPVGSRIAFVGEFGDVTHYTMIKSLALDDPDIMLGLLDYELTPDIHPAKVLPPDVSKKIPNKTILPVVVFDQHERVYVSEVECNWNSWAWSVLLTRPFSATAPKAFMADLKNGDSGNPAFIIYQNKPILAYCVRWGGPGGGSPIHYYHEKVQKAMNDLCPGYKLEFAF